MICHLVLMKFRPGVDASEIRELEEGLDKLPDKIVEIQSYDFGRNLTASPRAYDFGLSSVFANVEALKRYQDHPDHKFVLEKINSICSDIAAVDFELSIPDDFSDEASGFNL